MAATPAMKLRKPARASELEPLTFGPAVLKSQSEARASRSGDPTFGSAALTSGLRLGAAFLICCFLWLAAGGCKQKPEEPVPRELAAGVWGVCKEPDRPGPHSGVVLLHGAVGWRPEIVEMASRLADSGFVALAIDYYAERERTPIRSAEKLAAWGAYQTAVRNAVGYLRSLPSVAGRPVGLIGFSRGAFLAVSVASSTPGVGAVVDFYGGGGGGPASLEEDARGLPPVLILHGDSDTVVPLTFAFDLRDAVIASGGEAELHVYPGAGHVFNLSYSATYSEEAARDAEKRMLEFLRRCLDAD